MDQAHNKPLSYAATDVHLWGILGGQDENVSSSFLCGVPKVPEVRRNHDGHLLSDGQPVTTRELCLTVGRLTGQHGSCMVGTGVCVMGKPPSHARTFL